MTCVLWERVLLALLVVNERDLCMCSLALVYHE